MCLIMRTAGIAENGKTVLVTSSLCELAHTSRRDTIAEFFKNSVEHIGTDRQDDILERAKKIQATGVKAADSCHVACAELAGCDYFLTTDDRILKYKSDKTTILNPVQFIQILSQEGLE